MEKKLRRRILESIWKSQPGRLGLNRRDYVFHLRKTKPGTCVVWFSHRTDHDKFLQLFDDDTLGEPKKIPIALLIEVGYMENPQTDDEWEFPIDTEASMIMTTEDMVYSKLGESDSYMRKLVS